MLKKENKKVLIVFLVFFIVLCFQNHFMWLYHDDYGYAALSYTGDIFKLHNNGFNTSLVDLYNFCIYHYNNWGGRVLYFFFEGIIMHFGIHGFRLFQSVTFTLLFYYIYKIVSFIIKKDDYKLAIFIASLYGIFELELIRDGVLWFTASILYIIPLLPFLIFIYRYVLKEKNKSIKDIIIAFLLVFLASFSQEQVSAMVVAFIILYNLDKIIKNKKFELKEIPVIISSLIGFVILLLCPGNKVRMGGSNEFYQLSIFARLAKSIPDALMSNFGGDTRIFTFLFMTSIAFLAFENINNKKNKKFNKLNIMSFISTVLIMIVSVFNSSGYFRYLLYMSESLIYKAIVFLIITIQLLLIVYTIILYFYRKKEINIIRIFIASLGSQVVMLIAPYFPLRCVLMFEIMSFLIIGYAAYEFYKKHGYIFIIPIIIALSINYLSITYGYIKNNDANAYNYKTLMNVSKRIEQGENISSVTLKKLNDDRYASCMPYEENHEYIYKYMKPYFKLPEDFVIEYK